MSFYRAKLILLTLMVSFCSFTASATQSSTTTTTTPANTSTTTPVDANKQSESFETICLASWMKRFADVQDKLAYQNFGQKYCACALTQPLDTDTAVDKAIQVCMSRTLLAEAMDALRTQVSFEKATDKDINQFCQNKWKLIYPQMSAQAQQNTTAFCTCAQPKLAELVKNFKTMVDNDFKAQIDTIAGTCSEMVKPAPGPKTSQ